MISRKPTSSQALKYRLAYLWNGIWMGFFGLTFRFLNAHMQAIESMHDGIEKKLYRVFTNHRVTNALAMIPTLFFAFIPMIIVPIVTFALGILFGLAQGAINLITRKPTAARAYSSTALINLKYSEIESALPLIISKYENTKTRFTSQSSIYLIAALKERNQAIAHARINNAANEVINNHLSQIKSLLREYVVKQSYDSNPVSRYFQLCTNSSSSAATYQPFNHGKRLYNIICESLDSAKETTRLRNNVLLFAQARRTRATDQPAPGTTELGNIPTDVLKMILARTEEARNVPNSEKIMNNAFNRFKPRG